MIILINPRTKPFFLFNRNIFYYIFKCIRTMFNILGPLINYCPKVFSPFALLARFCVRILVQNCILKFISENYVRTFRLNYQHASIYTVSEIYQKLLYDMWTLGDAIVTRDAIRTFYNHSRLLHYCLTPLLFLPR